MTVMRHCTLVLALALSVLTAPAWGLQKGDPAPKFSLTSMDGQVVAPADISGKVVALSFWATWGKHCEEEMKQIQDLSKEFGEEGFIVLGVDEREDAAKAAEFAKRVGATYRILMDDGTVARAFGVNGVPDLFLIDRKGIIGDRFMGYAPTLAKPIRDAVKAAVTKTTAASEPAKAPDASASIPVSLRAYAHLQLGAAHLNVGDAFVKAGYTDAGHFDQAVRELRAGLAMDPKNAELHIWLGLALERKNERAAAVREYQTAVEIDPKNVYAQDCLRRLGVPPAAPAAAEEETQPEEQQ
jgi:peroxiredoxin